MKYVSRYLPDSLNMCGLFQGSNRPENYRAIMQWSIEVCVYHLSCMYIHIYFLCNYTHISHKEAPVCIKGLTSRSARILYPTHLIVVFAITSYMHVFYFNRDFTASGRAKAMTANIIHMTVHWVLRPYRLISQWSRRYHGRETSGIRVRKNTDFTDVRLTTVKIRWVLFLLVLCRLMMCANDRAHCGLMVVFACLHITLPHYHHFTVISKGIELLKCFSGTFGRVCV